MPPDLSATALVETGPVKTSPVEPRTVETAPVDEPTPAETAPNSVAPSAVPTGPLPAPPLPSQVVLPSAPTGPTPAVAPPSPPPDAAAPPAVVPDPVAAELTAPVPAVPPEPAAEQPFSGPEQVHSPPGGITVPEQRGAAHRGSRFPRPDTPADQANKRVRVVLAERKGVARPVRTVITIQESSGVGELLRRNLIGSQLAIALRFAIGAGLTLGLLPLLFAIMPEIGRLEVVGIRLPWLLLGVLVYPFLFGLGLWHTRTAEHLEQNFAETVQD
jgi:hypothetical protein